MLLTTSGANPYNIKLITLEHLNVWQVAAKWHIYTLDTPNIRFGSIKRALNKVSAIHCCVLSLQILPVCSHCRNTKSLNRMPIRITIILTRWRMNPNRRSGNERTNIYIPFSPHRKYSKQVSCKFTAGRAKIYFPPARIKHSERINWENQIGSSEKPSVYLWGVYSLWTYVFWNRNHFGCGRNTIQWQ